MKKTNRSQQKKSNDAQRGKQIVFSSLFGSLIGLIIFICLVLSFSAVCLFFDNPHIFILPLSFFSLYASAFFAGFAAVKKNGSCDALFCGSISGAILAFAYIIIFAIIAFFIPESSSSPISFLWRALVIPASVFGGYIASATHTKKRRRF